MRVGVYGRSFDDSFIPYIQDFFDKMEELEWEVSIFEPFSSFLETRVKLPKTLKFYKKHFEIEDCKYMITIGGDGTFLDAVSLVRDKGIPLVGINTGRLGFLATVQKDSIMDVLDHIAWGNFKITRRSLLTLETKEGLFGDNNFALNEVSIHKKDSSSMITIHTYLDGDYLNSYWADGLIVSSPTGSTAYSLSCGGPIILPGSKNHVITPIAPHNLNVRPVVLPDQTEITMKIEGRGKEFWVAMDARSEAINASVELTIKKSNFYIHILQAPDQNFFNTLRNKMLWGLDKRN